jgi:ribonuclease D
MIAMATETSQPPAPAFEYVEPPAFSALGERLKNEPVVGIDTEFMRETTFVPELCLLQISTRERIFCADPLGADGAAAQEADELSRVLTDRCWVVHAGRQDLEVLYLGARLLPREIFDTQVAAALLGYAPQLGYAALMAELFGASIPKLHTRADWRRRPLSRELLEYAAEDVQFLLPARDVLCARLEELGRLDWALADSAELLDPSLYAPDPDAAIERLKGALYLAGAARRIAASLAAWRETKALEQNRPRQWILRDATLLEIAVAAPASQRALERIPGLAPKTARRHGAELLRLVQAAQGAPDDPRLPQPPRRPDEGHRERLKALQARVAGAAAGLGVAPEVVASRKELAAALSGARDLRVFRGWRRELIGEELLARLD